MSPDNTEHACVKKKEAVENEVTSECNEEQEIGTVATPFTTPLDIDCTGQLVEQKDGSESFDVDSTTPKEYCIPTADQETTGRNCTQHNLLFNKNMLPLVLGRVVLQASAERKKYARNLVVIFLQFLGERTD